LLSSYLAQIPRPPSYHCTFLTSFSLYSLCVLRVNLPIPIDRRGGVKLYKTTAKKRGPLPIPIIFLSRHFRFFFIPLMCIFSLCLLYFAKSFFRKFFLQCYYSQLNKSYNKKTFCRGCTVNGLSAEILLDSSTCNIVRCYSSTAQQKKHTFFHHITCCFTFCALYYTKSC
jgi:hypothetical protein